MPIFARPSVCLGAGAGIIILAYCAIAAAMGCFAARGAAPRELPIVEEMPPGLATIAALPRQCADLPVLAGVAVEDAGGIGPQNASGSLVPVWVQASSFISTARSASSLFDPDPATYWHIDLRGHLPVEWVVFDLGAGKDTSVAGLQIKPRLDAPAQLFTVACLLGGDDRESWNGIARLDAGVTSTAHWIGWRLAAPQGFRYYQLIVANEDRQFSSVGKLRFLAAGQ